MGDYLLLIDGSSLLSTQYFGNLPREILYAKKQEEKEAWYHKIMMAVLHELPLCILYNGCHPYLLLSLKPS